ncbi:hypothetical protein [Aeromonas dhakensis]|uniref:hypothetical protein n=1 Tax=Aeromonas dhakensis TaxID=196024 RepID=UPI00192010B3|nr:hypothetical protein [Aeromonas dhakensis]MBL0634537.1 hypothetical protein [Aeromonas dhakensis]
MKAYLDTNILRQLSRVSKSHKIELICSQLGIMELIAGMTSEKEYNIRKSALIKILEMDVSIIWESIATLQSKAFSINITDYDVPATKYLMDEIIKTKSLSEAQNIKISLGGNTYSISTLSNYDDRLMDESVSIFREIASIPTERRREIQDYNPAQIRQHTSIAIVSFLEKCGIMKFALGTEHDINREFTPEYLSAIEAYYKSEPLQNYLTCLSIYILDAIRLGRNPGRNDGHDIAHLAYTDDVDFFVSNDKIYHRLPQDFFSAKFLRLDDFIAIQ